MRHRFTLTELLVVVCGTTILASLTTPSTWRAKELAKQAQCAGNLKQSISSMQTYGQAYGGWCALNSDGVYSWWSSPGMPEELGLDTSNANYKFPVGRINTFCPSGPEQNHAWYTIICYGTPRLSGESASDYATYRCEKISVKPHWEHVRLSLLPDAGKYIILADSAYGPQFPTVASDNDPRIAGGHVSVFYRRNSNFSAISMRHNGDGNVGYADGHAGDTKNRDALWMDSQIGSLLSNDGLNLISFYENN